MKNKLILLLFSITLYGLTEARAISLKATPAKPTFKAENEKYRALYDIYNKDCTFDIDLNVITCYDKSKHKLEVKSGIIKKGSLDKSNSANYLGRVIDQGLTTYYVYLNPKLISCKADVDKNNDFFGNSALCYDALQYPESTSSPL